MKKFLKTIALASISLLILISSFSCAETGITQEDYDNLKTQLSEAEAKIASLEAKQEVPTAESDDQLLKDEISTLEAKVVELESEITKLDEQNDTLTQDKAFLEAQYTELNTKYEELQEILAEQTQPETITTEQIENEIFRLLNEARVEAGVPEFIWGNTMYNAAKQNSRKMAETGKVTTTSLVAYVETFWAIHYETVDKIARAALLSWQANQYRFEHGALLVSNEYGAIGVYESGPIFYITFMASGYP
jgi:uncharacterized protein YkwD